MNRILAVAASAALPSCTRAACTLAACTLAACTLAACALIDQRTFDPDAGKPPPAAAAAPAAVSAPSGPAALLTFRTAQPAGYDAVLKQAIADARRRKPDVAFDVATIVPAEEAAEQQVASTERSSLSAAEIARAITAQGVAPSRIRLSVRTDPALTAREIRIYVH